MSRKKKGVTAKEKSKKGTPAPKKPNKQKYKESQKLNFFQQCFFTDISDAAFARVLPLIKQYMPRTQKNMTEKEIRAHFNAILYLSTHYTPWIKIKHVEATQRFYYRLKQCSLLGILQRIIGLSHPLIIRRPVRKNEGTIGLTRKRKCPPCPKCGQDTMICYGTRHQGSAIVRNYRCQNCGQTKLWVSTCNHEWWRDPRGAFKNHPTYCG